MFLVYYNLMCSFSVSIGLGDVFLAFVLLDLTGFNRI